MSLSDFLFLMTGLVMMGFLIIEVLIVRFLVMLTVVEELRRSALARRGE